MKKPTDARIGQFDYTIEFDPTLDEIPASGMTSQGKGLFLINPTQSHQQQCDTLVHESLHGMWKQSSLLVRYPDEDPDSPGELIIQDLAPLIYAFIRDNPEVVKWIQHASQ